MMPFFNWEALKPNQVKDTIFDELDYEHILEVKRDIFSIYTVQYNLTENCNLKKKYYLSASYFSLSGSISGVEHGYL